MLKIFFSLTLLTLLGLNSDAQSIDQLTETTLQTEELRSFVTEFIQTNDKEKGIFILHMFYHEDQEGGYEIRFESHWHPQTNDVASLAYTKIAENIVLIYSGLEELLPSQKRYKAQLDLIRPYLTRMYDYDDIPPTGIQPWKAAVLCGSHRVYESEYGFLPEEYSCVYEESPEIDK